MAKKKTNKYPFEINDLGEYAHNNFDVIMSHFSVKTKTKAVVKCLEHFPNLVSQNKKILKEKNDLIKQLNLINHLHTRMIENKKELEELEKTIFEL